MARLQTRVRVNTRYRVEKAISETAADATAGDNRGRVFRPGLEGGGREAGVVPVNREENVAVFGDEFSHGLSHI